MGLETNERLELGMADVTYVVHESPAWRAVADYVAMVDLAPFGFPDMQEQVWLRSAAEGGYETCCIPFRAYGLTLGDVVELDSSGSRVVAVRAKGGHRAFRIFFPSKLVESELQGMTDRINTMVHADDLTSEWSGNRHVAIDVSPGRSIDHLWQEIQPEIDDDKAIWEWGDVEPFRA